MRTFITLLLFVGMMSHMRLVENTPSNVNCLQMDIMIVGDFSASIHGHERFVNESFIAFANQFDLSENGIKIGIVAFNSDAVLVSPLTSKKDTLLNGINRWMDNIQIGSTNMHEGMRLAMHQFATNGQILHRKMIIIISDGLPNSVDNVLNYAEAIKNSNIDICSVLIIAKNNNPEFMKKISTNYCYVESSYENLIYELKKLDICM